MEARAFAAQRALLRDADEPCGRARLWLSSVLSTVGHGLLRSVSKLRVPRPFLDRGH
jgi:hypothetical protein